MAPANGLTGKKTCKERMIIPWDATWKSVFDIWMLLLVGYSCFFTMYEITFSPEQTTWMSAVDEIVFVHFLLDLIFSKRSGP